MVASIPSPSTGNLGPFHMYGLLLAIGVVVAVVVAERRWRNRGYERNGIYDIAFWVVIAGVVGARVYHVVTDYQLFEGDPLKALAIWMTLAFSGGLPWNGYQGTSLSITTTTSVSLMYGAELTPR